MMDSVRRFEMGKCLDCGHKLTGVSGPDGEIPRESVMVCAYCSHIMEWTGEKLVELSAEAIKDIAGDKDVMAAVGMAAEFQRRFGK